MGNNTTEYTASELLSGVDKKEDNKKSENDSNELQKDNIEKNKNQKVNEQNTENEKPTSNKNQDGEKSEDKQQKQKRMFEDSPEEKKRQRRQISDKEMSKIEKSMNTAGMIMKGAAKTHQELMEKKEEYDKEKEEYKVQKELEERGVLSKENNTSQSISKNRNKKDSILSVSKQKRSLNRGKNLSKIDKINNITKKSKRTKSVSYPLFTSNYMVKVYGLNTWIKLNNHHSELVDDFGPFQNINKLETIYENTEFMFKDGDKVDFETFLEITSPNDLVYLYAIWTLVNNDNEPAPIKCRCEHCNDINDTVINIVEMLQSSIPYDKKEEFREYDSTKSIGELQQNTLMGKEVLITQDIEDELRFKVRITVPSLRRYFNVDRAIRKFIVSELEEYLPDKLRFTKDLDDKLKYLWETKRKDVRTYYQTYITHLLYIKSIKIIDLTGEDFDESMHISLKSDDVFTMVAAINNMPDELLDETSEEITELSDKEIEYDLKGEPFRCKHCGNMSEKHNIPVGNMLFFTIQKMIRKRS